MAQLEILLLGAFEVRLDGEPVTAFRSDKVRALLVYLALRAGQPHRRESLAGLFWPDQSETAALHNLRQSLVRLHAALGDEDERRPFLLVTPKTVQFNPESDTSIDVAAFEALVSACQHHRHRHRETCHSCSERLEAAAALYRGPLLAGFFVDESISFDEWLLLERERLHRHALEVLADLARYHERRGDYMTAEADARRQVGLEPWREEAHRQLMLALALQGERSAALAQYLICRRLLGEELGVEPADETTALYEQIRAGQIEEMAGAGRRSNLPVHLTPLLGRAAEVDHLVALLQNPACRLVTLVGPPGIGKTRLALEAAPQMQGEFDDGVAFVPLGTIKDPALVAASIAQALDLGEGGDRSLAESLYTWLHDKELLLVLDNCEHLLAAAPLIGDVLARCRRLAVLATSQAALHLQGEQEIVVPPLALPDLKRGVDPDAVFLGEAAAVQLFVDRARAVKTDFRLEAGNAEAVAEICVRLDGLPLAIELAAACSKLLPPQGILARLSHRLTLLSSGTRDAPPRQQTLRAAIGWSYDLLEATEQELFRRLAVFVGSWTLEATEVVCGGDTLPLVLDAMGSLLDKSLIRQVEPPRGSADGEPRFTMLETIRAFALDLLEQSGELPIIHRRHAAYYLALAERLEPMLAGPEQAASMDLLEREHDNLRAVLAWGLGQAADTGLGLRLAAALWWFWGQHGYVREGLVWLEAALAAPGANAPTRERAKALYRAAILAWYQGAHDQARALSEACLALAQDLGDLQGRAWALHNLGRVAFLKGDYRQAAPLLEESEACFREAGDLWGRPWSLDVLGQVAMAQGDYATAVMYWEESLQHRRRIGDVQGIPWPLTNLGEVAAAQGDNARAQTLLEESLARFQAQGVKRSIPWVLDSLGQVATAQGDYTRARALLDESLTLFRELGGNMGVAHALGHLGEVALNQGDLRQAAAIMAESLILFQEVGGKHDIARVLYQLGRVAHLEGDNARAAHLFAAAEVLREAAGAIMRPIVRTQYESISAAARARLDEPSWTAAWTEGRAMTLDQAVAYALSRARSAIA